MSSPPWTNNYTHREVKSLVRAISRMTEMKDRKEVHVRLIDFDRAFRQLMVEARDEARALYVSGVYQIDFRDAEEILKKPHSTIHVWYISGLKRLTKILNGEL